MSEEETIAYAADLQALLDKGLTLVGAVAYLDARKSPLVFDPVPDVAAVNALPELLERVKRLEADLHVIAFGWRYVAEPDNSFTKSDWTRDQLIEYARAALKDTP